MVSNSLHRHGVVGAEILRRADRYSRASHLVVDFYRIRQKVGLPLPVREFPRQLSQVRGFTDYPYAIWVLWELEERIFALGEAGKWEDVAREVGALTEWRRHRQLDIPDLCFAHLVRIFVRALDGGGLPNALRRTVLLKLRQIVDEGLAVLPALPANSVVGLMKREARFSNIPTIGALALAWAAIRSRHPRADAAQKRAKLMADLWLAWGDRGQSEGACYDGYTADFFMDWLAASPAALRKSLLRHSYLQKILEEIERLGAPGRPENLAPLGDVEPFEMRFHYSFAAKFLHHGGERNDFVFPAGAEKFLRCDALPYLPLRRRRPRLYRGLGDAHYALTLTEGAVKVAVSWSNSLFGHMQSDWGSLVIAVDGEWLLSDPGYRQYLPTSEQTFTLGPAAHNNPVINGESASLRPGARAWEAVDECGFRLDLGQTYAKWTGAFHREIRMDRAGRVVVDDHFSGAPIRRLAYHWHGHPRAAWHIGDGWATILGDEETRVRFTCEAYPLERAELQRLKGSRGHLSIVKILRFAKPRKSLTIRWIFETAGKSAGR
jgi:hypothetical protein